MRYRDGICGIWTISRGRMRLDKRLWHAGSLGVRGVAASRVSDGLKVAPGVNINRGAARVDLIVQRAAVCRPAWRIDVQRDGALRQ